MAASRSITTGALDTKPPSFHQDHPQSQDEDRTRDEGSERARIERLGRERPPKFTSLWAEIGFCYSILASQFMAVGCCAVACTPRMFQEVGLMCSDKTGILRLWFQCDLAHPNR